ncbi:hypothetical protein [Nocardia pseudovaccinii]|uniref:hypothetical protein n=1 Tax=Nocardia pseudovaccinii TaxID=189540 RepID=UPI0007A4D81A|nr:hypothetical protein [Nocardia pseudovaccinii]
MSNNIVKTLVATAIAAPLLVLAAPAAIADSTVAAPPASAIAPVDGSFGSATWCFPLGSVVWCI